MRRRSKWEKAGGGSGVPPDELLSYPLWCERRGFEGWEYADPERVPAIDEWCNERAAWAEVNGGWPGDSGDGASIFNEVLDACRWMPIMPWSEAEKYI